MILVGVDSLDPERRIFLYGTVENLLEFGEHIGFEYLSAVFGTPHNMVLMSVGGVIERPNPHGTPA